MIYYEVVHQVVVLASNFHNLLYLSIVSSLWLVACSLLLVAWGLWLRPAVERPAREAGLFILRGAQCFHQLFQVL